MTARWDKLPTEARPVRSRRRPPPTVYRCCGAAGCGELLTDGFEKAQRHADSHGGCRLEVVCDR